MLLTKLISMEQLPIFILITLSTMLYYSLIEKRVYKSCKHRCEGKWQCHYCDYKQGYP